MNQNIPRVRFAPSPTGYLHIGGLRTALYNYLFAKNQNGKLILRIEDTDRKRFVEGAIENLIGTLNWAGINFDEGPEMGGDFGPYLQSERLDIYKNLAQKLISEEKAYYCFCAPERLEKLKEEQRKQKLPQAKYDKNCIHLSKTEIDEKIKSNIPFVIRLNIHPGQKIIFNDVIRETVEFDTNNIDDQVLVKSDGYPTYHLANVVDDHLMEISHVIRGEEWLSSTPKHIILYDYFGWDKPVFAHLPLLLNPDKSKLSKRQGDVAVEDYREKGYLKEALINFVALLGWNFGDDKEFYEMDELIKKFSLERVHKAGAVFNIEKLNWLNFEHLRKKTDNEVLGMLKAEISRSEFKDNNYSDDYLLNIVTAMKERVSFIKEYLTKSPYFFKAPESYEEQNLKKRWKEDSRELLLKLKESFEKLTNPLKEDFEKALDEVTTNLNVGKGKLVHPLRIAVSGIGEGPGVYDIVSIIGKKEIIKRIDKALDKIKLYPSKDLSKTEKLIAEINSNVFFKEFTYSSKKFVIPDGKTELELADNVVWLDEIFLIYQIKDRNADSEGSELSWFDNKVLRKSVTQIKNTLNYFEKYKNISIFNERGHKLNISEANQFNAKKIIIYTPTELFPLEKRYLKFYKSKTAGLIHLFHSEDYNWICRFLITPSEVDEYLSFRENLYEKHEKELNTLPEQYVLGHFLETTDIDKLNYSFVENLERLEKEYLGFDVSFIIENFQKKIIKIGKENDYYFIIKEIAKLDRAELREFRKRFNLSLEKSKSQQLVIPYRMTSLRTKCGYVFIPMEFDKSEFWQNALLNFTSAHKYEQKLNKSIGMIVAYNLEKEFYDMNWVYIENDWKHDSEMENMLKDNFPFREANLKAINKYHFKE